MKTILEKFKPRMNTNKHERLVFHMDYSCPFVFIRGSKNKEDK